MHRAILIAVLAACLALPDGGNAQERVETPERGATPASRPAQDANYRFGPEDVLQIQVWGKPELSGTVTVDYSGKIQIPLVGEVQASGRRPGEIGQDLTERFQILDPSVSEVVVWVAEYRNLSVTVVGEVRSPGPYGFREMPTLWDVLLAAGGPTAAADLSDVQVIREERTEGDPYTVTVDLSRGIERTPVESLPQLRPKDRILVPTQGDVPIGGDNVNVIGAVRSPGVFRLAAARTVVDALTVSGGPAEEADLGKVYLTRANPNGVVAYELDIQGYLHKGKPLSNLELEPGDTITVPKKGSWFVTLTEGLSRLIPFVSLAIAYAVATN